MTHPLSDPQLPASVTADGRIGQGASALIAAASSSGHRGRLEIKPGTGAGTGGGVLATISFSGGLTSSGRIYRTVLDPSQPEAVAAGSLSDPDLRPIVLTSYPAPPAGAHFQAVPLFNQPMDGSTPLMTGFQVLLSGAGPLPLGTSYLLAWAVL